MTSSAVAVTVFQSDTVVTGMLRKKSSGMVKSYASRFFALGSDGLLNYWKSKDDWASGAGPKNETPFNLKLCVVKFDMTQSGGSRKHHITITPKGPEGGSRELELEANSATDRDNWRSSIRGALAFANSTTTATAAASELRGASSSSSTSNNNNNPSDAAMLPRRDSMGRVPPPATEAERNTELGKLLTDCRLDEYTHTLVTVEGFTSPYALVGFYHSSPSAFEALIKRSGLKLGQGRKLRKRLGIPVEVDAEPSPHRHHASLSSSESGSRAGRGGGGGGGGGGGRGADQAAVGVSVGVSSSSAAAPAVPSEDDAWEQVRLLRDENTVLKASLARLTAAAAAEEGAGGGGGGGGGGDSSWGGGRGGGLQQVSVGRLLTNQIPVVVAYAEATVACISADAGAEDKAVVRLKFEEAAVGFDVTVSAFGEPLSVKSVAKKGRAAEKGIEAGDLVIEINGSPVPTDHTEAEIKEMFARFKRPVTIGFYRLRMATEQAERVQPYSSLAEREANEPARAVASPHSRRGLGGGEAAVLEGQPRVLRVDGCPDGDCNGAYTVQPHKIVNGMARYLKNHSFYYLYRTRSGQWCITWFEPDIDQDKGEYISEEVIDTPERPSRWLGTATGAHYSGMVVYVRGSMPMLPPPPPAAGAGSSAPAAAPPQVGAAPAAAAEESQSQQPPLAAAAASGGIATTPF